jgi:hypothetical protein
VNTRRCANREQREAELIEALAFTRLHLAAPVEPRIDPVEAPEAAP